MSRIAAASVALALLVPGAALAETLYKLIDKKGRVTYTQEKPQHFDGEVIEVNIDLNANRATLPKFTAPEKPQPAAAPRDNAKPARPTVAQAQARVDAARAAYENARDNPGEGDVRRVGNVGGGTRPVFSEQYLERLARLENELKQAEADLGKMQGGN